MITIIDVAKKAGVSVATVSRVLNDSSAVTAEKKELVMKAIQDTGYIIPSRMKITQSSSTNGIILVIAGTVINTILEAIQSTAGSYGYQSVSYAYPNKEEFDNLKQLITKLNTSISGIILLNCVDRSTKFQNLLLSYPVVQIGEPIFQNGKNYTIYSDEIALSYDAVNYLFHIGKKNLGLLTSTSTNPEFFSSHKREKGFFLGLLEHNATISNDAKVSTDVTIEGGYDAALKLLDRHPEVDAIVCTCDAIAMGCIHALLSRGIPTTKIEPFSLDYNEVWELFNPYLPYIDPHLDEMGSSSVQMLISLMNGESISDCYRIIPHELVTEPARKIL